MLRRVTASCGHPAGMQNGPCNMEHPPLDVLKEQPLPEVAAALRDGAERIVARWRALVVSTLPQADELTRKQFENSVPGLLRQMADALEAAEAAPTERLLADAPYHGETRYHQEFNLNELFIEYHLLRRVILEELSSVLGRPLTVVECVGVNTGVDVALRQAAVEFAKHQADAIAAEANTMSNYLSFLSHDLRGGLNGAILMIEVIKRELASEPKFAELIEDLDITRRSMLDTCSTMDRFLQSEKLRRGKMPVKVGDVDLATLMRQVVRGLNSQIQDRKTRVEVNVAANLPPTIRSDGDLIVLIVQNLAGNAVKYSDGKPVELRVSSVNGGAVRISVVDQGPGIAPEMISKLFAPFQRGETHGKEGTGLGLTIARQAADLLGAKLWAESEPGNGAVFHLELK